MGIYTANMSANMSDPTLHMLMRGDKKATALRPGNVIKLGDLHIFMVGKKWFIKNVGTHGQVCAFHMKEREFKAIGEGQTLPMNQIRCVRYKTPSSVVPVVLWRPQYMIELMQYCIRQTNSESENSRQPHQQPEAAARLMFRHAIAMMVPQ